MKSILLVNIGRRDIKLLNNEEINKEKVRIRDEKILNDFDNLKKDIELPILQPIFDYFKNNKKELTDIYIFATDQSNTSTVYLQDDTINSFEIIKKMIREKKYFSQTKLKIIVIDSDPNLYDIMYRKYKEKLEEINSKITNDGIDNIYISFTGGTPAQSVGLLFSSIEIFENKVIPIYKSEALNEPTESLIVNQLLKSINIKIIRKFIESYNYQGALTIGLKDENLKKLVELCFYRLNFEFDKMYNLFNELKAESGFDDLSYFNEYFTALRNGDSESFIQELIMNILIKQKTKLYTDMIGRLFRLNEAFLHNMVEREFHINLKKDKQNKFTGFKNSIEKDAELMDYFNSKQIRYDEPNRHNLREILKFKKIKHLNEIENICTSIEKFSNLRNDSIIAHGFSPVKEDELKEIDQIIEKFNTFYNKFDYEKNSMEKLNEIIYKKLT